VTCSVKLQEPVNSPVTTNHETIYSSDWPAANAKNDAQLLVWNDNSFYRKTPHQNTQTAKISQKDLFSSIYRGRFIRESLKCILS
jgi:hypothetical protein